MKLENITWKFYGWQWKKIQTKESWIFEISRIVLDSINWLNWKYFASLSNMVWSKTNLFQPDSWVANDFSELIYSFTKIYVVNIWEHFPMQGRSILNLLNKNLGLYSTNMFEILNPIRAFSSLSKLSRIRLKLSSGSKHSAVPTERFPLLLDNRCYK